MEILFFKHHGVMITVVVAKILHGAPYGILVQPTVFIKS